MIRGARYVVLGLAHPRSTWFRDVAQWANDGSLGAEFVKCLSAEEVRARLASGRPYSALLADGALPSLDRDLVRAAQVAGCAVLIVGGTQAGRDWVATGAAALLPARIERKDLAEALSAHAQPIGRADRLADPVPDTAAPWQAPLVAVTGPGGTGASTAAIGLAQGLAADVRTAGAVLLADFRLHAEQGMLHDAREVAPGVQEVVDAFRAGRPGGDDIRAMTFAVPARGYHLLLGLRRAHAWSTIRPRAFEAALAGLRCSHRIVVADVDADLEGEDDGGSIDVEERHTMSRTVIASSDVSYVVGLPGMKGLHALARVVGEQLAYGVPGARIVPVINRAPRAARARADLASTLAQLLPAWAGAGMPSPIFLPERRVDEALRDGVRVPDALAAPLAGAYHAIVAGAGDDDRRPATVQRVVPGSLGAWTPELAVGGDQ